MFTPYREGRRPLAVVGFALSLPILGLVGLAWTAAPVTAQEMVEQASQQTQIEELRRQVEQMKQELDELRSEKTETAEAAPMEAEGADEASTSSSTAARLDQRLAEIERQIEVLAGEVEREQLGEAAPAAETSEHGYGPAASKIYRTGQGLSIGGYGEMLYQGYDDTLDDGSDAGATDQLDFLRAIVYFGYKWNDRWLFNSEIELEHASTEDGGEAAVEFAYLDYLWKPELNARAGLLLIPMGFINELHEPTTFLGARRPDVERFIIPSTWRENGFGLFGEAGPVSYRTYVVNGFEADGFTADEGLREGRQAGAKASAEDLAWVGRLDYTPVPGLLLGGSAYVGSSGQGLVGPDGETVDVGTTIYEGHAEWRWRGLELRFLGTRADLDDVAALNRTLGLTGTESIGDELSGWYAQVGYDVLSHRGSSQELIPYVRWEQLDTQSSVPTGFLRAPANDRESLTLGLAWKPFPQAIVKADYQDYDNGAGTGLDQLNVALGYIF